MNRHDHDEVDYATMDHSKMNHNGMDPNAFMSMVMMTKDLPISADGLRMEDGDMQFGPNHPSLPSELVLHLTMDGDTVRKAHLAQHESLHSSMQYGAHATQLQTELEWVHRLGTALNYSRLVVTSQKMLDLLSAKKSTDLQKLARKLQKQGGKNPFLGFRLKNLAVHQHMDAYQRLGQTVSDIVDMTDQKKVSEPTHVDGQVVASHLEGLELAQALAAAASFHIGTKTMATS
jgi:hypothetical protein